MRAPDDPEKITLVAGAPVPRAEVVAVLLASRSEAELRQTHARYFKNVGQLVRPSGGGNRQDGER